MVDNSCYCTVLFVYSLLANYVPVYNAVQTPGSFIVTYPQAYHVYFVDGG